MEERIQVCAILINYQRPVIEHLGTGIGYLMLVIVKIGPGPMLASGMCTDVFQFDVSAAAASGAIVPATSVGNITPENGHNSSHVTTVKNRRVLYGLPTPLSGSNTNITKEQV
ncbi:basic-leucine zipper domain-containing protein [Artemisia annua]|uniref:Basic-leucine zipper domain-containing protein n=1 Tax=Artemisia annua TaxID=35608 RepID=A0A2U1QIU6_ARTAN|nr:basic-leucine zipper domain-containing protein [Artemisia annua]